MCLADHPIAASNLKMAKHALLLQALLQGLTFGRWDLHATSPYPKDDMVWGDCAHHSSTVCRHLHTTSAMLLATMLMYFRLQAQGRTVAAGPHRQKGPPCWRKNELGRPFRWPTAHRQQ